MTDELKQIEEEQLLKALPPAGGQEVVPNVQQFVGMFNSFAKVYRSPDEAVRHSRENARAMRRSLIIMEPLRSRQMASAELPWHLEPEDNKDKDQLRVAKELTRIIEDIPDWLQYKMSLLEGIFFGRWSNQNVYGWDYSSGRKRLVVKSWTPVHGDTLVYRWDQPGQVGLYCNTFRFGEGTKDIEVQPADIARAHFLSDWEREAFVIHKHEIQAGDFFEPEAAGCVNGIGLRTYLYWTWYQYQEILAWFTQFLETTALGQYVYRYELGNSKSEDAVRKAAETQDFAGRIIWPASNEKLWKDIEKLSSDTGGIEAILRVVQDFYGGQIKRMILGQVLSSEVAGTSVASSTAEFQEDTFERIIRYDSENLANTLTRDLVAVLLKYNYPGCPYKIKFKFNVDRQDPDQYLRAAREFYNMGGAVDEDELRELIGLSKPTKDSSILRRSMTGLEMGQLAPNAISNQLEGGESGSGEGEGENSDHSATKIDAIKKAVNMLGVNARADDVKSHLESQGLRVSQSLVYGVLHDLRGVQNHAG